MIAGAASKKRRPRSDRAAAGLDPTHRPVAIGFLLGTRVEDVDLFLAGCRDGGFEPLLIRPVYEVDLPDHPLADRIRSPMDYLTAADIDAIYTEIERMQRRLPSIRLRSGRSVAEWGDGIGRAPTVWTWLPALVPYWHVTLRLIRTIRRVMEAERPASFEIIGEDPSLDWTRAVITTAAMQKRTAIPKRTVEAPRVAREPTPEAPGNAATSALDRIRTRIEGALAKHRIEFRRRAPGPFTRHVVLLMRGTRGTAWLTSRTGQGTALIDEYSEGMPEALVEECRRQGARLTIVYEGALPDFSLARPSYSRRHPGVVDEISTNDFAGIASIGRATALARFDEASAELIDDPAFRSAFTIDGVDAFAQFEAYIRRSITNLSALTVTQYEAWRFFLENWRPDVVIGGRLEAKPWISRAAHDVGAATVSIKLGIGEEMMPSMIAIDQRGTYAHTDYPDAFLVWGARQSEYLSSRLPEFRGIIRAVGRARSDTFVRESLAIDAADLRRRLGIPPRARVVVYGANHRSRYGQWPDHRWGSSCFSRESYVACFRALLEVARDLGDGFVLVKPHPADDIAFIADLVKSEGGDRARMITAEMGFHNLEILTASDIFVSTVSSMFAEAVALGRVCVNIWRPDVNLLYEQERWHKYSAIAAPADDFETMKKLVRRFLRDPKQYRVELERAWQNISEFFGEFDGGNARRAARAALDIAGTACEARRPEPDAVISEAAAAVGVPSPIGSLEAQ